MIKLRRFLPLAACVAVLLLLPAMTAFAQETTSGLQGTVAMKTDGSALPGVSVEAVHVPTGTHYRAVTTSKGYFAILNLRPGGPYTVTAKISGFKTETQKDITVALGETRDLDFALEIEAVRQAVEVTASEIPFISPDRMGSTSAVSQDEIKTLPTIRRQFQDFARTNPYVNVTPNDITQTTITFAGKNNRYNSVQIDGAVNNDIFGLSTTGTPGGLTDTQPISLDTIQELQVAVSPYDIKQGGFTGGAINMITRSGTNDFHGSVYGSTRNENSIGSKLPQAYGDAADRPVATFTQDQYGARLGGPIWRDRLFFFGAGERNKLTQPTGGAADGSGANNYNNPAQAALFQSVLINQYGYNPGGLGDYNQRTNSDLLFGRLDVNATDSNQVTFRYNYVNALQDVNSQNRNSTAYTFETAGYTITDKTNSGVLQVNSVFGKDSFNQGRVGYQTIRDVRAVPVQFPSIYICGSANSFCSGSGTYQLVAGTERSSGANVLNQDLLEVTDDFTFIKGNHTITIGTHNEFFKFYNLFIQDIYGTYYFNSVADLQKGTAARYAIQFANVGDGASQFRAQQWGLYVGDQWRVSNSLTVNLGLRFDLPRLLDSPTYNPLVYSTFGVDTSVVPNNNQMISPRLGFNWSPGQSGNDQVRGGVGVFAGRTPFVWISNNYGNTGIGITNLSASNVTFNPAQPPPTNFPPGTSAITTNGINPDFKFPQVLRSTLAYDRELPMGIRGSVEYMFTKTLEDIFYYNLGRVDSGTKTPWGTPVYKQYSQQISNMFYLDNTTRGEQQDLVVSLEKRFPFGLYVLGTYAYMNAKAGFEGTSSVAQSNWQFYPTNGDIYTQQLTRSQWEVPHRFNVVVSQAFKTGPLLHNVGFVYFAQSGQPYSILMGGDANNDGATGNELLYVPQNYNDIVWKGAGAPTEAQWNNYLSMTGLDKYVGRVESRNGLDAPWIHSLDFHYDITLPISVVQVQLTFDVLNLINFINNNSGLLRYVTNQTYTALTYSGVDAATGKPIYTVNCGRAQRGGDVQHQQHPLALPAEVRRARFVLGFRQST